MATNKFYDIEMKVKNQDGGYDVTYPISKASNIKTKKEISVLGADGEPIGSYNNGDTIPEGTTVEEVITKLVQKRVKPNYVKPEILLFNNQGTAAGDYEVGTSINVNLSSSFTQKDAGQIVHHKIKENAQDVNNVVAGAAVYAKTLVLGDGETKYVSNVAYGDGPIKNDNMNQESPDGQIKAGDISSEEVIYNGIRHYFTKSDTVGAAPSTSQDIRGLDKSAVAATKGVEFNLTAQKGNRRVVIAFPAKIGDVTSIKYVEAGNDEVKGLFAKTSVNVEGANNFTAVAYNVYTLVFNQALKADMTFKVTI